MMAGFIDQMKAEGFAVESICRVLREQGCQIAARTYRDWARANRPVADRTITDAMVVDLAMPDMDGYELIARLRQSPDPDLSEIPAAALTAFARSEDRTKALESGFELHLSKPIEPEELVASVARLVRRPRPRNILQ